MASVALRNDSDDDLRIYAIDNAGRRTAIGTVMRASLARLVLRGEVLRSWDVQFVAVPIGGGAPRPFSCPLKIRPGTALQVRLDQNPISWSCGRK